MQAATPPMQTYRAAVKAPDATGRGILKRVAVAALDAERMGLNIVNKPVQQDARDINRAIGSWLGFEKVKSVISTFGSVANATWKGLSKLKTPKVSFDPKQSVVLRGIGDAAASTAGKIKRGGAKPFWEPSGFSASPTSSSGSSRGA